MVRLISFIKLIKFMSVDQLTFDDSERICRHMNHDHQDALIKFAFHYGGLKKEPKKVTMIDINPVLMKLEVDGLLVQISFNHKLKNSEDAHKTLVSMLKEIPQAS